VKIVIFTQDDPFYVKAFFDEFFRTCDLREIAGLVISNPMGKKSSIKLAKQMYEFYGPIHFFRMGLRYAFIKLIGGRPAGKSDFWRQRPRTYTVKQLARGYGLDVIERSDLNSLDFINFIRQYDADLFISVASPIIFKEELIKIPKIDCINIHSAPLPKYRGMLPSFWQLYHGEKEAGITIHRIDSAIDTGDIIAQQSVPICAGETLNGLMLKTKREGAKLMLDVVEDFRAGRIHYKRMDGAGSYFSFPTGKDVTEFKKRGNRLF
jgi:methionyl-tRNA formyltransferase